MNSCIIVISMLNNQNETNENEKNDEIMQLVLCQFNLN